MSDQQLTLDDLAEEPLPAGWSQADVEWFQAGCPLPCPYNIIPIP